MLNTSGVKEPGADSGAEIKIDPLGRGSNEKKGNNKTVFLCCT